MTPAGPDSINLALNWGFSPAGTVVTLTGQVNDTRYGSGTGEPAAIAEAQYAVDVPYWDAAYAPSRCPRGRRLQFQLRKRDSQHRHYRLGSWHSRRARKR